MNTETKEKIKIFLREQMANIDSVAKQYIADDTGQQYPRRTIFERTHAYASNFLSGDTSQSWCVITGLRGVGKTTLLMQILSEIPTAKADILFLSVDRIVELFGVSLSDVLRVYEEVTSTAFERRETPLFLFIDEAQCDKKWGVTLKDVYDRARHKVFIYTTGSAALLLHTNNDPARRPVFIEMLPLDFVEYMRLKHRKSLDTEMRNRLRAALLESKNAKEVYEHTVALEHDIKKYYETIPPLEVQNYIRHGSLPFTLSGQPEEVFDACDKVLSRTIGEDIAEVCNFRISTIRKAPTLLYMLASMDQVSYESLGKNLQDISRHTVKDLLGAFVSAGVLLPVFAYTTSHNKQVKQRSKFLFTASVFRSAIFNKGGSVLSPNVMYAKLLEDVVGLILWRLSKIGDNLTPFLTYDAKDGGADFVVGLAEKCVVVEVGAGSKGLRQVEQTAKRVHPAYSIVIDNTSEISFDAESNTVRLPLEYFLLV